MGLMGRCDIILRLPGYSKGGDLEVEQATEQGQPVYHSIEELLLSEEGDFDGLQLAGIGVFPEQEKH